ncbi:MAG: HD domain-containing protein [Candidatus Micrarchaeota archaeon]|nr:HD domain-containing protein [Candidatus Micrarchaeota archaeon]
MNIKLRDKLVNLARKKVNNDLSHSFDHILRVLNMAERIGKVEKADLDIIVPAALFHDIVVYKGTKKQKSEIKESIIIAQNLLNGIKEYPKSKIPAVKYAISVCSFSKNIRPKTLEAKILQDSDLLEATGAISIMRTFGSSAVMGNRSFYDQTDPFSKNREPNDKMYSLDLFFTRLLIAKDRVHTKTAKKIAKRRTAFLQHFLNELNIELKESN